MAKVTPQSEIEEFAEEGFRLLAVGLVTVLGMRFAVVLPRGCRRGRRGCRRGAAAIDDLVELAAIEPHAAAARAVVDLDAAALGHDQGLVVHRTFHGRHYSVPTGILVYHIWGLLRRPQPFACRRQGVKIGRAQV